MSTMRNITVPADASRLPMTLPRLAEKKRLGEPIVMVTAYDYPSALAVDKAGVDLVLVGDSGAMTVLGYPSTVAVALDELLVLAKAVRRGLTTPFLVGDLPFGSYEVSDEQAVADRVPLRQGGGLRRGQARGRRRGLGRPRPRDRPGRHPGDGPRRPHAADRRPRWAATAPRAARPTRRIEVARQARRPAGGRLLLDRLRGDPERGGRGGHAADGRRWSSASAPARRPTARSWSSTTCSASARAAAPASSSATPTSWTRWSPASPPTREDVRTHRYPAPGPRLLDPGRGAGGLQGGAAAADRRLGQTEPRRARL